MHWKVCLVTFGSFQDAQQQDAARYNGYVTLCSNDVQLSMYCNVHLVLRVICHYLSTYGKRAKNNNINHFNICNIPEHWRPNPGDHDFFFFFELLLRDLLVMWSTLRSGSLSDTEWRTTSYTVHQQSNLTHWNMRLLAAIATFCPEAQRLPNAEHTVNTVFSFSKFAPENK